MAWYVALRYTFVNATTSVVMGTIPAMHGFSSRADALPRLKQQQGITLYRKCSWVFRHQGEPTQLRGRQAAAPTGKSSVMGPHEKRGPPDIMEEQPELDLGEIEEALLHKTGKLFSSTTIWRCISMHFGWT